jgi:hypothetical protein
MRNGQLAWRSHRNRSCEHICRALCGADRIRAAWWRQHLREEVDGMLNLFLILAALTGLPAFTEVGRLVMSLLVRLIGLAFVIALVMIMLLALATHGKVI